MQKRDDEINKCILEWLFNKNYTQAAEGFMLDTKLKKEDASKGNKLEKKWGKWRKFRRRALDVLRE
jgi:hypothetical protein